MAVIRGKYVCHRQEKAEEKVFTKTGREGWWYQRPVRTRTHSFPANHLVSLGLDGHKFEAGKGDAVGCGASRGPRDGQRESPGESQWAEVVLREITSGRGDHLSREGTVEWEGVMRSREDRVDQGQWIGGKAQASREARRSE
jgi:hypothetical protein